MHRYWGVVPARAGSKGVKDKNIKPYLGKPLAAHSLITARQLKNLTGYCFWSDSENYKSILTNHCDLGLDLGIRESHCEDLSMDWQYLNALDLRLSEASIEYDAFVLLRPTTPLRSSIEVDNIIEKFDASWDSYDSLRTVNEAEKTPFKMWFGQVISENEMLGDPISSRLTGLKNAHSIPRQLLPVAYIQNGVLDIIKKETVHGRSSSGDRVMLSVTSGDIVDIDHEKDFR